MTQQTAAATPSREDFAAMLNESLGETSQFEGKVVTGTIIEIDNDYALIDIGLKSEGRVPVKEFAAPGQSAELVVGDTVEVYVDRVENAHGEAILSRDKARREEAWEKLEKAYEATERVEGVIFGRVKGGFTVDLSGAVAFLPGSQVDVRPVRDVTPLLNIPQPFQILKMDRKRGNIVVSRRAILEETRAEQRADLIGTLAEGQVVEGVVKNITDYGAFVDLGGIDGLLHVTDISWRRIGHPTEALSIGETVKVQIVKLNPETQRISLGMKQLEADPWEGVEAKYPVSVKIKGRVTNITDYGAFVELEPGVEGLIHVSEMSWTKKNVHPGKIVSTSQEVEVMVLEVDPEKRRISLGLKQCLSNPWEDFSARFPAGTEIEGEIKNITEFGLFVGLDGDVDGMVHMSDIDWNKSGEDAIQDFKKGDVVKAVVLDVDTDKERISLGMKQLAGDPFSQALAGKKKGDAVTCTVSAVQDNGIEVTIAASDAKAFIRRSDLARDRGDQRPDRFAVGDKVDALITNVDRANRKVGLSVKQLEITEEKAAVAQYGTADSGASLGDILGAAMNKAREAKSDEDAPQPEEQAAEAEESAGESEAAAPEEADEEAPETAKTEEGEAETEATAEEKPKAKAKAKPKAAAKATTAKAKPKAKPEAKAKAKPKAKDAEK